MFHQGLTTAFQIHGAEFHTLCALLLQLCVPPGIGPGPGRHLTKISNADEVNQHEVKPPGGFFTIITGHHWLAVGDPYHISQLCLWGRGKMGESLRN